MKQLLLLCIFLPIFAPGQNNIIKPADLRTDKILFYLNSYDESTKMVNDEYERCYSDSLKSKRKKDLAALGYVSNEIPYAIHIDQKIVQWMNESIQKICEDLGKNYTFVDHATINNFPEDEWRYVLKTKYIFKKNDILEARQVFFFYDRKENKDLFDLNALDSHNAFRPFFYFIAAKIYPEYYMLKVGRIKKEWKAFFLSL
jgi:hypothetical protein